MGYNQKNGFTLIELIMVIAIVAVFSFSGVFLTLYMLQHAVTIPKHLNVDMLGSQGMDIMVEGDQQAKGLRFSRAITRIRNRRVDFINQDGQAIRYRIENATDRLDRCIEDAGGNCGWAVTPYYQTADTSFQANGGPIFLYYDAGENVLAAVDGNEGFVRRIEIHFVAQTGTGLYDEWEGRTELTSSIAVNRY